MKHLGLSIAGRARGGKGDFPGGPVVKTSPSSAGGVGSVPGQGAKIPHASEPKNQNIKQQQYCNKFNKDFKTKMKNIKKEKGKEGKGRKGKKCLGGRENGVVMEMWRE